MTAVTSPEQIAGWLAQLETPAGSPPLIIAPGTLEDIIKEAVQHARDGRYLEALYTLEGKPYPQPFASLAGDAVASAGDSDWLSLGLVLWMRGVIHLQAGNCVEAYIDLHVTRDVFDQRIRTARQRLLEGDDYNDGDHPDRLRFSAIIAWCQQRRKDLQVDLACNAEEVYGWIHGIRGEEQVLRPHTRQMWHIISSKIRNNEWQTVEKYLEELVDFSDEGPDYLEKPEVLTLCGRALHQIHMHPMAVAHLRRAVAEFHPRSHKQAAARWMLGTVQWCVEWEQRAAIENLERSIEEFEQLQANARRRDQKASPGDQSLEDWYGERLDAMRKVLADRISKRYP